MTRGGGRTFSLVPTRGLLWCTRDQYIDPLGNASTVGDTNDSWMRNETEEMRCGEVKGRLPVHEKAV